MNNLRRKGFLSPGRLTLARICAIDREIALALLHCMDRYLETRNGDVKKLRPPMIGYRLRCGDYRIFFRQLSEHALDVIGVRHRRDAYR